MANNTRVNELQDKLLKAMDILNAQALNSISFDKTITCKIENDKDKKEGKYEVSDDNRIFAAYSTDTRLRTGDTVYVTVPEGNFENQKMIIGKKTADNDKPFNFIQPFDTFFDMTGNLAGDIEEYGLLANDIKDEHKTLITKLEDCFTSKTILDINENISGFPTDLINYPRLAVRADFRSWIKNAVRGNYGLLITLTTEKPNTTTGQTENGAYNYLLDSSMMYGNPYNFETYYSQEIVLDLEKQDIGRVIGIRVDFYQNANFYDKFNNPIPSSENGFLKYITGNKEYQRYGDEIRINDKQELELKKQGKGYYKTNEDDDTKLEPNIFINNLEIYFGQDISSFETDLVELYTKNKNTYKRSTSTKENNVIINQKEIKIRWVHLKDGNPIDMNIEKNQKDTQYEIRWYKYRVGAAAADEYCGVYWEKIQGANGFNYIFNPDVNRQQEKIKAIIICDSVPYRSNEIVFENEENLPPSEEAQHIMSALNIIVDDGSNGNYMIYGQDNSIKDTDYGKMERTLSVRFDADNDGKHESNIELQTADIEWIFPTDNSMIELISITNNIPKYKIASYYSPSKTNNTIGCKYTLNTVVYITETEFTFGPAGTMGSEQTLIIDFVDDTNAIDLNSNIQTYELIIRVYDKENKEISNISNINWSFYYDSGHLLLNNKTNQICSLTKQTGLKHEELYILKVEVGELETYFPIPLKSSNNCDYISGPTQVIYQSNGEPAYYNQEYQAYNENGLITEQLDWNIISTDTSINNRGAYDASIENGKLKPIGVYVSNAPVYGVKCVKNEDVIWTQPILVLQNKWPSTVINKWDGKSIEIDNKNGTILTQALAAGSKNTNNEFSGIMIGKWQHTDAESSLKQTGVYGFHNGAMSYAFIEDGKAFLGKEGRGRIYFDGDNSTIYSKNYKTNQGMMIDLGGDNTPYIDMKNGSNNYIKMDFNNNTPRLKVQSGDSYFLLDTENNSSKIYLKGSKGQKAGAIILSTKSTDDPLTIGSNFHIEWDGTLHATNGNFSGTIDADDGTLSNLDIDGSLSIVEGGALYLEAEKYTRDGPIYIDYNDKQLGTFGLVVGKDGDTDSTTYNIGITSGSNTSNGVNFPSIVLESQRHIRLSAQNNGIVFIDADHITFKCDAANQSGIYARFA